MTLRLKYFSTQSLGSGGNNCFLNKLFWHYQKCYMVPGTNVRIMRPELSEHLLLLCSKSLMGEM